MFTRRVVEVGENPTLIKVASGICARRRRSVIDTGGRNIQAKGVSYPFKQPLAAVAIERTIIKC